jgi:hypothetical protein
MIPKVCHVVSFKEPFAQNNSTIVDNNLHDHLNPMRVQPEEEKYDIEWNHTENSTAENFVSTVKNNTCCFTRKQLFEYIIVSCITAIFVIALIYIIYIIRK